MVHYCHCFGAVFTMANELVLLLKLSENREENIEDAKADNL